MMKAQIPRKARGILAFFQTKAKGELYLVGGFLRDLLLSRDSKDLDLLYFGDPRVLLEGLSRPWFPLDPSRGVFRVIWDEYQVDIAAPRAQELEEDLKERDFTVNAMAFSLSQNSLVDPWGGREDLRKKRLRVLTPWAFREDPLRVLRTFRLALQLGFSPTCDTLDLAERWAGLLVDVAPERIRDEISLILAHPQSSKAFLAMDSRGILDTLLPEVEKGQGILQGKWRGMDLKGHLLASLWALERLLPFLEGFFSPYTSELKGLLNEKVEGGISREKILKLASLIHDIGKPCTMVKRPEGLTFWGHDREGGEQAKEIGKRLGFGTKASDLLAVLVGHHMWIHLLARQELVTQKAKGRFFRQLGEKGLLVCLLSLADALASSGERGFFYLLPYVRDMFSFYYDTFLSDTKLQRPLLNGREVMNILGISPGPMVGQALRALLEAQGEGKVNNKKEAIAFVKNLIETAP